MSDAMSDDLHALSGAYAVDALDDVERARFERHLSGCPACQAEVASLAAAAGELAAVAEQAPPPGMRAKVMADIARVRPLPPLAPPAQSPAQSPGISSSDAFAAGVAEQGHPIEEDEQRLRRRRSRLWRGLVAASLALIIALGGLAIWRSSTSQPSATVADQVLAAPDATRTTKRFPDGSTATVVRSDQLGKAVLVTSGMAAPPSGKVYQLWLQDPSGHFASAGLMPPGADQVVVLDGDARTATGAGITVEPAGGSSQPTTTPIALFSFA